MKCALIVPYFGKLPNYFQLVLNSCGKNAQTFDWLFYVDDETPFRYPANCIVRHCSFEDLGTQIQSAFDFKINLTAPYKLCDFRPAYGYIFERDLADYDFWGHCDIDCIFGDLSILLNKMSIQSDRIMRLGHLCLYRNNDEVNTRFMLPIDGESRYEAVFTSGDNCIFDEHNAANNPSIDTIWERNNFSQYLNDRAIANVHYKANFFRLVFQINGHKYDCEKLKRAIFYWDDGRIIRLSSNGDILKQEEFAYIHLMRRPMAVCGGVDKACLFKIIPNAFEPVERLPLTAVEFKRERWCNPNVQYLRARLGNLRAKLGHVAKKSFAWKK